MLVLERNAFTCSVAGRLLASCDARELLELGFTNMAKLSHPKLCAKTFGRVIINHSHCLHKSKASGRPNKPKAVFL